MINQNYVKDRPITEDEKSEKNEELEKVYEIFHEFIKHHFGVEIEKKISKQVFDLFNTMMYSLSLSPNILVREYYFQAKKDHEAAKLLTENKIFPPAVFHVQQAVEKLTKAYALHMGLIKEEELYRKKDKNQVVGHISPKAFILLLKKRGATELVNLVFVLSKRAQINVKDVLEKFEKLLQETEKLAKVSRNEIILLLRKCENIANAIETIDRRKTRKEIDRLKIGFISRLKKATISSEIINRVNEKFDVVEGEIDSIFNELATFSQLYFLAIITFPHFSYSRYSTDKITLTDYNEGLGIVDSLKDILTSINNIMNKLEKFERG